MDRYKLGSTWVSVYRGKLWPVMLCGETGLPQQFLISRHENEHSPAILLGRRKYIWVSKPFLHEFDPSEDYLRDVPSSKTREGTAGGGDEEIKLEKQRRVAFKQDAPLFKSVDFWTNYIEQEIALKYLALATARKEKRKRQSDGADLLPVYTNDQRNAKRTAKGTKTTTGAKKGNSPTPNLKEKLVSRRPGSSPLYNSRFAVESLEYHKRLGDENITIFVGSRRTKYFASRARVGTSDFLSDRTNFEAPTGLHIDLSGDECQELRTEVFEKHFIHVHEYLRDGDFTPNLIEDPWWPPRLDKIATPEDKDDAALHVAYVFEAAAAVELGTLQLLCLEKLKVISPIPLSTVEEVSKIVHRSKDWAFKTRKAAEGRDAYHQTESWLAEQADIN